MTEIADIRESMLGIFLEKPFDIRSPYALYDHPKMWNLFEQDGITTAVRPSVTQERVHFQLVETPGIGWGRHRDGVWIAGDQHRSASWDHFINEVLKPALAEGAVLLDPERFAALVRDDAGETPSP